MSWRFTIYAAGHAAALWQQAPCAARQPCLRRAMPSFESRLQKCESRAYGAQKRRAAGMPQCRTPVPRL